MESPTREFTTFSVKFKDETFHWKLPREKLEMCGINYLYRVLEHKLDIELDNRKHRCLYRDPDLNCWVMAVDDQDLCFAQESRKLWIKQV